MEFYTSIADFYREIFPLNPAQIKFVLSAFPDPQEDSLLDVGCGAGDLAAALAPFFKNVQGIDLDQAMLDQALSPMPPTLKLEALNMLDMSSRFEKDSFDGVYCFGNTLVHLDKPGSVHRFLEQARDVLRPGGKLLIQIIHYDRILDQDIRFLPTIDTARFRFERNYRYLPDEHRIEFETIATHKEKGAALRNKIHLLPLRTGELHDMLEGLAYRHISYFGNFKKAPLHADSIPLILQASKRDT